MEVNVSLDEWLDSLPEDLQSEVVLESAKQIKILMGLNPSQVRAVRTIEGPTQINAVAGSGKTAVLVKRVAYMLSKGIKPQNIMVTTFTKKAAEELLDRLKPIVSKMTLQQLTIGTTHSIGFRVLKKEYEAKGNPMVKAFTKKNGILFNGVQKIFGDNVKKAMILDRTIPTDVKMEIKDLPVPQLLRAVGSWKNQGLWYDDIEYEVAQDSDASPKVQAYSEFYTKYEQMKQQECVLDGDDLIFLMWKMFKEDREVLDTYRRYYKYILVDEAQDNNGTQYELFNMLAYPENNLFVVGDDDQSMYSFRGARPDQFINFKQNYPGTSTVNLEDNYRSHPHVLEVANKVIAHNKVRLDKKLKPNKKGEGHVVTCARYEDETAEAKSVVEQIAIRIEQDGVAPKSNNIIYRTNAQSRAVEEQLIIKGIPYVIHGGVSFYERKEVKDIVAYLQMATNPTEHDKAFKRIVNIPSRYLGKAFLDKVADAKGSHWEAITGGDLYLKDYEKRGIHDFMQTVGRINEFLSKDEPLADAVTFIVEDFYRKYLEDNGDDEEDTARLENIDTLKFAISRYDKIEDFLEYIEFMNSTAKMDVDGVQLMTIHKSKGLEFEYVNLIGFSDGTLPHFRAVESTKNGDMSAIEEERRLLYVAITRAIHRCTITSPGSVNGKPANLSRFGRELGIEIMNYKEPEPEDAILGEGLKVEVRTIQTLTEYAEQFVDELPPLHSTNGVFLNDAVNMSNDEFYERIGDSKDELQKVAQLLNDDSELRRRMTYSQIEALQRLADNMEGTPIKEDVAGLQYMLGNIFTN